MKGFSIEDVCDEMVHTPKLSDKIWAKPGIAIVAPGSLACTYALRKRAALLGKEKWLFPCPLTEREYSLGKQGKKIKAAVKQALKTEGIRGIIIYASCMEILTKCSLEDIEGNIKNPENIPVEVLYRGPLAKRKKPSAEALDKIWKKWGIETEEDEEVKHKEILKEGDTSEMPDFQAAVTLLENVDCDILLFTPGGCKSSLVFRNEEKYRQKIKSTRFSDIFISKGDWKGVEKEILENFPENRPLFLAGSAVPEAAGFDLEGLAKRLTEMGKLSAVLKCTGFKSVSNVMEEMKLNKND